MILNFEKLNFSWYIRSELNAAAHFLHSEFGAFCGSVNAAQADLLVFFPQQQFVEFVSRSDQLIDQLSLCVCLCLCVRWSIRADWADHIDGLTAGGEWRLLSRLSGLELSADQARFSPRLSRETCFLCRDVGVNGAAGWPLTSSTHTHTHCFTNRTRRTKFPDAFWEVVTRRWSHSRLDGFMSHVLLLLRIDRWIHLFKPHWI